MNDIIKTAAASVAIAGVMAFMVHKAEHEGVIELDVNGRILTDLNERPEWAHGLAVAMLEERKKFYTDRLGETAAAPLLASNTIDMDDLHWVGFDEAGDEVEVEAETSFRTHVLATALGVNEETGEVEGAIAEHEIAQDTKSWTQEAAYQDANADKQKANGTNG